MLIGYNSPMVAFVMLDLLRSLFSIGDSVFLKFRILRVEDTHLGPTLEIGAGSPQFI